MKYSALITTIETDSRALPAGHYTTEIKQKFLDAVVSLSPTASIDNVKELVKDSTHAILNSQITLPADFVKLISLKYGDSERTRYTFVQVTADLWERLGTDPELDPVSGYCFYFIEGRIIKFYISLTGNLNTKEVVVTYLAYPTQWDSNDEMYEKYSSLFIEACKIEAVKNMIALQRGEQNDMG